MSQESNPPSGVGAGPRARPPRPESNPPSDVGAGLRARPPLPIAARTVDDIDWPAWQPHDRATLAFVLRADEILLIRKKRGLGAGKINGPGGRLDPGETPAECAVREVNEELHVTPKELEHAGTLLFQFVDGYALHVEVFRALAHEGEARETDEAIPLWTPINAIPFDEMWADDRLWFPHLLAGRFFAGRFLFDKDQMLDHQLELTDSPA